MGSRRRSLRSWAARLLPVDGADDSLARWVGPAVLIGVVAGLGAAALFGLLHLCTGWLLESVAGYRPYRTSAEGGFRTVTGSDWPWLVPLVAAGGALVATVFALWLAPEARGHGTDAAIAAAHNDPAGMRGRVTVVKLVASALTIGSGGSGGTEGPAAQISAAFGSVIARRTGMSREQARTALVIGLAAGVGAIFNAPLGGALLGAELLYRRGMDARVLPKALIASVAGWLVFGACHGFAPVLGSPPHAAVGGVGGFALVALVGLAAGAAGRLYTACFYAVHTRVEARARRLAARIMTPTVAALLVGGLGLLVPGVLGTGYGLMEAFTSRQILLDLPLVVVLAIPVAKIVGTALTVGSGGSGGIFGPCMVVGAGVGAALWRLAEPLGVAPHSPIVPVAVGMAACLGSVAHAPLGVLVMVAEMLGDASLLGPGALAVMCARAVTGGVTLYRSQLDQVEDESDRRPGPPHQGGVTAQKHRAVLAPVRREPSGPDPVAITSTDPVCD
ncbi:chloride channel protein [Streptomyces sp. TP-A0356]|uniref:chloride channel protein n=1 Tax=Streptomyces sp. TP-A0356 TaxID=1359208 RepID=UPI0006E2CDFF|nr:chloride channel protein [Streptomyces sp. TP-A0356]